MAALYVDDAEAAHSEAEVTVDQIAVIVRTPMNQPIALIDEDALLYGPAAPSVPARNSTHAFVSPSLEQSNVHETAEGE
jgi:hypothetical protein